METHPALLLVGLNLHLINRRWIRNVSMYINRTKSIIVFLIRCLEAGLYLQAGLKAGQKAGLKAGYPACIKKTISRSIYVETPLLMIN